MYVYPPIWGDIRPDPPKRGDLLYIPPNVWIWVDGGIYVELWNSKTDVLEFEPESLKVKYYVLLIEQVCHELVNFLYSDTNIFVTTGYFEEINRIV